ncbi:hypothetical protein L208DRAFT_1244978 [Tricholoma matsutake]|nr:hypothetical protein L208DRAFT_1244978 [Tricholoma matsutake 945]
MPSSPNVNRASNPCPRCGGLVPVKLAKGGKHPSQCTCYYCLSCNNHYVFPAASSQDKQATHPPSMSHPNLQPHQVQQPKVTNSCAYHPCAKASHRSCFNKMCKLCCID